jgi:hypothetical protein
MARESDSAKAGGPASIRLLSDRCSPIRRARYQSSQEARWIDVDRNAGPRNHRGSVRLPGGAEGISNRWTFHVQAPARALIGTACGSARLYTSEGPPLNPTPRPASPPCSSRGQRIERPPDLVKDRLVAYRGLIAAHDNIDVHGVDLNAAADAPGPVGGDEGRARAEEPICPQPRSTALTASSPDRATALR